MTDALVLVRQTMADSQQQLEKVAQQRREYQAWKAEMGKRTSQVVEATQEAARRASEVWDGLIRATCQGNAEQLHQSREAILGLIEANLVSCKSSYAATRPFFHSLSGAKGLRPTPAAR